MFASRFIDIRWHGATVRIEVATIAASRAGAPRMVFLHEGLGSISMWGNFPARLCATCDAQGMVYSRPGYGRSARPQGDAPRAPNYLHLQALEVLPGVLAECGMDDPRNPPWLFGHSDGGTIALLYAAHFPDAVAGVVAVAPHLFVEDATLAGVKRARFTYATTDWPARLARHHDDPQWVFRSWSELWLDPGFRDWNIEREVGSIRCPVLAVQGLDDEYGTTAQVRAIESRVPGTRLLEMEGAGHAPQRDQPERLVAVVADFMACPAREGALRPMPRNPA